MADNGALTPGIPDDSCAPCAESAQAQCGITQNNVGCSTPFCDPKLATLPKTQKGRLVTRVNECLHDTPSTVPGKAQVWVRGKDGTDVPRDLTEDMIPARGDKPCFRSIEEAEADTYGKVLLSQVDSATGKKCIKEVPLEDTDEAYLAGLQAEPVCSGTPSVRPKRIIPEDIGESCPNNIRILAAVEEEVEVQPGLKKIKTLWRWLKSIVLSNDNVEKREGDEEDGACAYPAVWIQNGDCLSLAKAQLKTGVLGTWAYCGGCLKFYELPKSGEGNYTTGVILKYVGGSNCWEWAATTGGNECFQTISGKPIILNSTTSGTKTVSLAPYSPPECAKFAMVRISIGLSVTGSNFASHNLAPYFSTTEYAGAVYVLAVGGNNAVDAWVDVPIYNDTIKFFATRDGTAASRSVSVVLLGFK